MSELQSQKIRLTLSYLILCCTTYVYVCVCVCSAAEKGKMLEILRRAAEGGGEGSEEAEETECSSLEERLAGVDLGEHYLLDS